MSLVYWLGKVSAEFALNEFVADLMQMYSVFKAIGDKNIFVNG